MRQGELEGAHPGVGQGQVDAQLMEKVGWPGSDLLVQPRQLLAGFHSFGAAL